MVVAHAHPVKIPYDLVVVRIEIVGNPIDGKLDDIGRDFHGGAEHPKKRDDHGKGDQAHHGGPEQF
ncbi:hypothetical protein SDC9_166134 [bioreactor metagenome]|uniref:Uncharacterized protein n=1 Tax=bioreactor metagenome TaxID=1076179 RepID=A0A645FW57_9ZZZZ